MKYNAVGVLSYGSDSLESRDVEFNREIRIVARNIEKPNIGEL